MHDGTGAGGATGLRDARDEHASGTQLGGGQEKIGIGRQCQRDLAERHARPQPLRLAGAQIGDERRQHGGQLLCLAGARLVVATTVGDQRGDVRHGPAVSRQLGADLA